jgi:5'(3')-deoxyribonucleotidase
MLPMKPKLFIDFDNTLVSTVKNFVDTYNMLYKFHPNFKKASYDLKQYDMKDQCPLVKNIDDIFSSKLFFHNLRFIEPKTKETLEKLAKDFELVICSLGTPKNIALKSVWLSKRLPVIEQYMLVTNNYADRNCKLDKSLVNMQNAIFIDDMPKNLESSNARYKILFGKEYPWNHSDNKQHIKCADWDGVYDTCMKIKDKMIDKENVKSAFSRQINNNFVKDGTLNGMQIY